MKQVPFTYQIIVPDMEYKTIIDFPDIGKIDGMLDKKQWIWSTEYRQGICIVPYLHGYYYNKSIVATESNKMNLWMVGQFLRKLYNLSEIYIKLTYDCRSVYLKSEGNSWIQVISGPAVNV